MSSALRGTHGFTLIEVLVAMAVFGIGILGFMALQTATITARVHAQLMTTATELTITQLNNLMLDGPTVANNASRPITVTSNDMQYTQDWNVTPTGNGLYTLEVTTRWSQKSKTDSVTLSAVIP